MKDIRRIDKIIQVLLYMVIGALLMYIALIGYITNKAFNEGWEEGYRFHQERTLEESKSHKRKILV